MPDRAHALRDDAMSTQLLGWTTTLLWAVLPFGSLTAALAVASALAVGGWAWTVKPLGPRFQVLDPLAGLGRVFSKQQGIDALKASILALVLGAIGASWLAGHVHELVGLLALPLPAAIGAASTILVAGMGLILLALAAFAGIDVPLQKRLHAERLKMSHQELKQEQRELDGNAEVKGKVRARMPISSRQDQAAGLRRMFNGATVRVVPVVSNPHVSCGGVLLERLSTALAERGARVLVVDAGESASSAGEMALVDLAQCVERLSPQIAYLAARGLAVRFVDSGGSTRAFLERAAEAAPGCNVVVVHASASDLCRMSARSAMTGPGRAPRSRPTTPVTPTSVRTSSSPRARRCAATIPAVRNSRLPSSGWAWMSRRHATSCGPMAATAASIRAASGLTGGRGGGTAGPGMVGDCVPARGRVWAWPGSGLYPRAITLKGIGGWGLRKGMRNLTALAAGMLFEW